MPLETKPRRPGGPASLAVELYVRSLSPRECRGRQAAVVSRLAQLEVDGQVDDYAVDVWGRQLAVEDAHRTAAGRRIRDRIEAFRAWADTHGRTVDPHFPVETVSSELTGEEYSRITFPTMALAEYEDGELRFVSPCTDDDGVVSTVADRLEVLESAERARTVGLVTDVEADE